MLETGLDPDAIRHTATVVWPWIALLGNVAIIVAALVVVPRNRRPTTALAWLLAILLLPYLGLVLFLLFGTNQLPARRRQKQAEVDEIIREASSGIPELADGREPALPRELLTPAWFPRVVELNRTLTAIPIAEGNRLELLGDYDRSILRVAEEIDTARETVHVMYYAMSYDEVTAPFFDALERAVRRGVRVRLLFDHIGSMRYRGYRAMRRRLREIGAQWHPTLSVWPWEGGVQRVDLRNHRKLAVIDGRVAFMGSQNMIERGYHKRRSRLAWKDLAIRIDGPMAAGVDAVFFSDWFAETGQPLPAPAPGPARPADGEERYACQIVPSGPGYENENNLRLMNQLLYAAEERAVLVSPYFVPDDSLMYAITTAVQRGIRVELFVGEIGDQFFVFHAQRSYYEALLRAGVRIWLYPAPEILHAKHMSIDDRVALIGSSNMDMRSFTLNAEMMLLVHGEGFVRRLREVEQGYRERCRELDLDEWMRRPMPSRALDNFARLTSVLQ
ncbi:MAG: cardiolipin synthase [Pseudoclavibacter sp.]|nr:cardiolipin synthase [Pseudoclavibacter sp.]